MHAKVGKDPADHIAAGYGVDDLVPVEIEVPTATSALSVIRLSDVVPERVSWLWPGRIPAGKLVTLDGDPSLGKSTLSLAFAAVITTGGTWPDHTPCAFPGDVILLSAEDGLADTVRPRLDAAGADVTRVHAVQGVTLPDGSLRPPTLADVDQLHQLVTETGARLLIVDVLMAYLPSGTDSHKDQDVRRVLSRLSALADATGCTVLLVRHLNKAKGGDPMYRGGGSIGIVGAVRAGMLVAKDPDDEDVRVLACTKSNLGPEPEALTYRLTDADEHGVARVQWIGTSTHDARALLADQGDDEDRDDRQAVETWLRDLLEANGLALPANEVYKHAAAAGFSRDQAKRAKARLGIKAAKGATNWAWTLPDPGSTRLSAPLLPCSLPGQDPCTAAPLPAPLGEGSRQNQGSTQGREDKQGSSSAPPVTSKGAREQGSGEPHAREARPNGELSPPTAPTLELVKLCRHCQEPVTGNTAMHVACALKAAEQRNGGSAA